MPPEMATLVDYDRRTSYLKFATQFVLILLLSTGSYIGFKSWQLYQGQQEVARLQNHIHKLIAEREAALRADTVGGTTPQETLRLYIEAVEAGDYELASKYFVQDKQEAELENLRNASLENIKNILTLLRRDLVNIEVQGSYNETKDGFVIRKPLLVDFKKYPSGLWKLFSRDY